VDQSVQQAIPVDGQLLFLDIQKNVVTNIYSLLMMYATEQEFKFATYDLMDQFQLTVSNEGNLNKKQDS
jgi:hypothetical protein